MMMMMMNKKKQMMMMMMMMNDDDEDDDDDNDDEEEREGEQKQEQERIKREKETCDSVAMTNVDPGSRCGTGQDEQPLRPDQAEMRTAAAAISVQHHPSQPRLEQVVFNTRTAKATATLLVYHHGHKLCEQGNDDKDEERGNEMW